MFEPWSYPYKNRAQIEEKDRWWRTAYNKLKRNYPDRKIQAMSPQFTSWAYLTYREIRRRFQRHKLGHYPGEKPMSGFYAVLFSSILYAGEIETSFA